MKTHYIDFNEGRGNGYDFDAGMSNNALDAYSRGVKPLSKITKSNLVEAGWAETKSAAMKLAKSGFWKAAEWHHSGGEWFNRVDFFNPNDLVEKWNDLGDDDRAAVLDEVKTQKPDEVDEKIVTGSYTLWGGSRRRPRRIGEQEFTGILRGNWIHLDDGSKKKADGRHIQFQFLSNN